MDSQEKQRLLADLTRGRQALVEVLNGLTEEAAARTPGAGKWSIAECVEHLAVAEDYLFSQILASQPADGPVVNARREALIAERGVDRTRSVPAPEVAIPRARFSSVNEALESFPASR